MTLLYIALVGPGIMPIPPSGWGAVEILIWDYAQELRKLGHHVLIINTQERVEIVKQIRNSLPDLVHIQYDEFADIIPQVLPYTKLVAVTSHYGYLEQPDRWQHYRTTFNKLLPLVSRKVLYCALSPGIAAVYQRYGLPSDQIALTINGADADRIRYTETPQFGNRSIYLGKIEPRKRQHVIQNLPSMWFVGNRHGTEFDYNNPRYLGEWDKPTLFQSLTDYGNLVLLSDGEADPLVVKEALVAGLGVVVSPWAAANLDTTLPFITVVPLERLNDVPYIQTAIDTNRTLAVTQRATIRKYSQRFFWSHLVAQYVDLIRTSLGQKSDYI